jgi:hypothetical protein
MRNYKGWESELLFILFDTVISIALCATANAVHPPRFHFH